MKKVILTVLTFTVLTSCFKQKPGEKNGYCACGRVESKSIVQTVDQDEKYLYNVTLRNRCSGNYKTFEVDKERYIIAKEKEDMCMMVSTGGQYGYMVGHPGW